MGLPAISRVTYQQLNSTSRRFVGLVRTVRNDAILLSTVHRLAINMDDQSWWVETQRKFELLSDSPVEAVKASKNSKKKEPPPSNFEIAEKFGKKPRTLPDGVIFDGVVKQRDGAQRQGVAYIHFFPNGYTEPATIYLNRASKGSTGYALELKPPLGKVAIFRESIEAALGNKR